MKLCDLIYVTEVLAHSKLFCSPLFVNFIMISNKDNHKCIVYYSGTRNYWCPDLVKLYLGSLGIVQFQQLPTTLFKLNNWSYMRATIFGEISMRTETEIKDNIWSNRVDYTNGVDTVTSSALLIYQIAVLFNVISLVLFLTRREYLGFQALREYKWIKKA
uniref:Neur_chan_LBD domain-containing protein n=1 Tax=Heterorhabditis bacteriophora TaxID=37862 RepID=A0A1I7WBH3_HETBA